MSKTIRILHVLGGLDLGGAEVMVMNLYRTIDRELVQFDFVVHTPERCHFESEIEQLGGSVFRVPRFTGFNIINYIRTWYTLFKTGPSYGAVHGHIGSSAAIYLLIAHAFKIPTIAHSHGTKNTPDFKGFMYSVFSFPTRYIADWFFACSIAAGLARYGKTVVRSSRFKVIKNAIQIDRFGYSPEIRKRYRELLQVDQAFVVGHVGRFDPLKNHRFLLDVFALVHELLPESVLLLVGDGEERSSIEEHIQSLDLNQSVRLLGARSDVPSLLQAMDVFLFPSIAEGLGISLIEAQATGLACVVSDRVPEEVRITELIDFVPLDSAKSDWAMRTLEKRHIEQRINHVPELVKHGYDISTTTRVVQDFYCTGVGAATGLSR